MALKQAINDVVTGRAALEGAKVVGRAALKGAQNAFEAVDKRVFPKSYARDKAAYKRLKQMQTSDGFMYTK